MNQIKFFLNFKRKLFLKLLFLHHKVLSVEHYLPENVFTSKYWDIFSNLKKLKKKKRMNILTYFSARS